MNKKSLWTKNFILIMLVNFFAYFAFQLFPSALPVYLKGLGASDGVLGWLQGILTIAVLIVRPISGIALDRYKRKGIFLAGMLGMLLVTAAYAFFPVVGIILVIRFAHGAVWGVANTACSTVATDNVEKPRFAEGMGYFSLAASVGMAIAPAVALSLAMVNTVWLAVGFLAVSLVLVLLIDYDVGAIPRSNEEKTRLAPYAKESALPAVIMFFMMITWGAVITFLAVYGAQRGIGNVGMFFTVYAVSLLLTRPVLGRLVDRHGFGAGIWPGVVLIPAALLLLSQSASLPMFLLCAGLYGVGIGAAQSSLQSMALVTVPKHRTGAANATFFTGFDAGIGLGAVIAGQVSAVLGYGNMFAWMAVFPLLAGGLYLLTRKRS